MVVEVVFTGLALLHYPGGPAARPQSIAGSEEDESQAQVWMVKTECDGQGSDVHHHVPRLTLLAEQHATGLGGKVLEASRQADGELVISVDISGQHLSMGPVGSDIRLHFPSQQPDVTSAEPADPSVLDFLLPVTSLGLQELVEDPGQHLSARVSLHGGSVQVAKLARQLSPQLPRPLLRPTFREGDTRAIAEQFVWRIEVAEETFEIRRSGLLGTEPAILLAPDQPGEPIRLAITNAPLKAELIPPDFRHLGEYGRLFKQSVELPSTPGQTSNTSSGCPPAQGGRLECLSCYPHCW